MSDDPKLTYPHPDDVPEFKPVVKSAMVRGLEFFRFLYGAPFQDNCEYCGKRNPLGPSKPCPHCNYVRVDKIPETTPA